MTDTKDEKQKRPNKINYYLGIAVAVAERSTCLRRKFGAIIVKDDQIISTGYVGAPRGMENCIDAGYCPREEMNIPHGQQYELCKSVHAEANAIINAARAGVSLLGGNLYMAGINKTDKPVKKFRPCKMCRRLIINAGLKKVFVKNNGGHEEFIVKDWIKEDDKAFKEGNFEGY